MAFAHISGLDHAVVMVRDLDAAADAWSRLGFTVSARGVHSTHVGSANHTVMLDGDYVELMGILRDTETNAIPRKFLAARGDGIERIALKTDDAAAAVQELQAAGMAATGPFSFGRPVPMEDGSAVEARFRIARWPEGVAPAGVRLFVCQHETPAAVWQPELLAHANTATRIRRVEIVSPDPAADAAAMARALGSFTVPGVEGVHVVASGAKRAALVFLPPAIFAARYPAVPAAAIPERGAMSLVFAVRDRMAALKALGPGAAQYAGDRLYVLPAMASGTVLVFEQG